MILTQRLSVTGVINTQVFDAGLASTEKEKKRLIGVALQVTGYADNKVQGYHERAKVFEINDTLIDLELATFLENESKPGPRITYQEVGLEIPAGETFKAAIQCGPTAKDLKGHYVYELIGG